MKLEKGMRIVNKSTKNQATIVEISPNFNIIDTIVAKYEGVAETFTLSKEDFDDFWEVSEFYQLAGSNADKVVRAVPRMENPYFPTRTYYKNGDVYTEPVPEHAEFEKKQQDTIAKMETIMNPFADKPNPTYPLDDDKIKYREGFRLACQVISIKAAKHLGPQHPVMLMIASLQKE